LKKASAWVGARDVSLSVIVSDINVPVLDEEGEGTSPAFVQTKYSFSLYVQDLCAPPHSTECTSCWEVWFITVKCLPRKPQRIRLSGCRAPSITREGFRLWVFVRQIFGGEDMDRWEYSPLREVVKILDFGRRIEVMASVG